MRGNAWLAYQLDQAVTAFGRYVDHELNQVKDSNETKLRVKRRVRMHQLLDLEPYTYVPGDAI